MRSIIYIAMIVLSALALPEASLAAWPPSGSPLSTAAADQLTETITSDGAGGAIVTWQDTRGGTNDIYARRVNSAGVAQWTVDGVALCTAAGDQYEPRIVSDGAGGAIVTWYDLRGGATSDIYVQRVDAAGTPQWTANGVALCTAANDQVSPQIVSDGAGGAIITWYDRRTATNYDVYAQRVDASGVPQWAANGVGLCTAANDQSIPMIATDAAGGAIVTWQDVRAGNFDVYAQRVNSAGVPQWAANGVAVCSQTSGQINPAITADGFGGAVMTWFDGRSGARGVYVQRVSDLGVPQWTIDGVALKTASTNQATMPLICADGSGGAIAAWMDNRSGGYDVYVRRVSSAGVAQWTANGVALCTAANDQYFPVPLPDGAGGAFVTWSDFRSGTILNLYAQRVSSAGAPLWTADGILVSTGTTDKSSPTIDTDGAGGAIIAWYETGNGNDVYVQRLNASGAIPSGVFGPARGPSLVAVQAYPNPFATTTAISVELATPAAARVDIYDVAGRNVRTLMLERAASHRFAFDGKDSAHRSLPSGVYFCRIQALGESVTRKLVIAR